VPDLRGELEDRVRAGDAGQVHQGGDRRHLLVDPRERGVHRGRVGDVDADADDGGAALRDELGGERLDGRAVDVGRDDAPALGQELADDLAADAALGTGAGDDGGALGREGLDLRALGAHGVLLRRLMISGAQASAEDSTWRMYLTFSAITPRESEP